MNIAAKAIDWAERIARKFEDPETHHAGSASPHYHVSPAVTTSQQDGVYVYHVPDNHLGQGASFGNRSVWVETKGNGDMLRLFHIEQNRQLLGGMSVSYLLPFSDLSVLGQDSRTRDPDSADEDLTATISYAPGQVHLHPACQQREWVIGDGLRVLQTVFVPKLEDDDPAGCCMTVLLRNDTPHPTRLVLVGCLDLRGRSARDMACEYDGSDHALLAWNESAPEVVRYFGASEKPEHYWATCDEEQAYAPGKPLPDRTDESGDLVGALQFDMTLLPGQHKKIRLVAGVDCNGRARAAEVFRRLRKRNNLLGETMAYFGERVGRGSLKAPSEVLTQGIQWAKVNMLRPVAQYPQGEAFTNDPGQGAHVVGRDMAWFVHGCDFVEPDVSCRLLQMLVDHQRDDGLVPEFIDAITGKAEYWNFNINDNTPLFLIAADHHWSVTHHRHCLERIYGPARKAAELILSQRNADGLVSCSADGTGVQGIAGWRNVLDNEQITGAVTELNAECCDALRCAGHLCKAMGDESDGLRYQEEAHRLRDAINDKLVDPRTNLYIRNIDPSGRAFTQATVDMVFPLLFRVARRDTREAVIARLFSPDFVSSGGLRALPYNNPRWDPSGQAGCLGGVWPGANWWFAMGCLDVHNRIMADSLERSYRYVIQDPKTFNTVPGQFNEWCDGQTLVNRGMRLSPWGPPRFLWAGIEGLAGLSIKEDTLAVNPRLPSHWSWLQVDRLPFRGQEVSFFVTRQADGLHIYTCSDVTSRCPLHTYDRAKPHSVEPLTGGMTATVFQGQEESILLFASSRDRMLVGPLLAHKALADRDSYEVFRLNSMEQEWTGLGRIARDNLQRIAVRIEPQGYTLYRFRA